MLMEDEKRLEQIEANCDYLQKNATPVRSTFEERAHQAIKDKGRYFDMLTDLFCYTQTTDPTLTLSSARQIMRMVDDFFFEAQQMEQAFDKLELNGF
jgi:hypothetical protein